MHRVCAWCKRDLDDLFDNKDPITHGICADCTLLLEYDQMPLRSLIEDIKIPIFLVSNTGIIEYGNQNAVDLLQTSLSAIQNLPGGNVFHCVYADLPEGCGKTIHCSGCTIRKSVMETFRTNQAIHGQKAYQFLHTSNGVQRMEISISTEKQGQWVLLQINAIIPNAS